MNRRQFLVGTAASAIAAAWGARLLADNEPADPTLSLVVYPHQTLGKIPSNYVGLSYESGQLADTSFFAGSNTSLVGLFRRLSLHGVLRIGGNSSEFANWQPGTTPISTQPDVVLPGSSQKPHRVTNITPVAIRNLAAFLDATGWRVIYGLKLGTGSADEASDEAAFVAQILGARLIAFQIGNEPDLYRHNGLRPPNWKLEDYLQEWQAIADAIGAKVPNAPLAGPDVAHADDWVAAFAAQARGNIVLLTGHYYAEGPPTNPAMTVDRLLAPSPKLASAIADEMQTSAAARKPFRMSEGNSCYSGGKEGVSDTFASALWAADYMLQTALGGYSGVNFHGGGNGWYTPIAGKIDSGFSARPIYYGMLLAGQFAGATFVRTALDTQGANITGYAAKPGRHIIVALFNKDLQQSIKMSIDPGVPIKEARLERLTAPDVASTTGVTFAGSTVSGDGSFTSTGELPRVAQHQIAFDLPKSSAALLFVNAG